MSTGWAEVRTVHIHPMASDITSARGCITALRLTWARPARRVAELLPVVHSAVEMAGSREADSFPQTPNKTSLGE